MDGLIGFIRHRVSWKAIDAGVVFCSFYAAFLFRYLASPSQELRFYLEPLNALIGPIIALYLGVNHALRLDRRIWRYAGAQEVLAIVQATLLGTAIVTTIDFLLGIGGSRPLPLSVMLLGGFFTLAGLVGVRYRSRLIDGLLWRWQDFMGESSSRTRALIYGAGETGQLLAWRLMNAREGYAYAIVGFIDDDPRKRGMRVHEIEVLGDRRDLAAIVEQKDIDLIMLAMPRIGGEALRSILSVCQETAAQIRTIPSPVVSLAHSNTLPLLQEVGVEDLLGRQPYPVDRGAVEEALAGRVVLVTGGCGSIGAELCRQIPMFGPAQLVVLDNNESGLYDLEIELRARFPDVRLDVQVGDITDQRRVEEVFKEFLPSCVFHAAAYKHVPLMERFPGEAVRVNIGGARLLVNQALLHGVQRFVLISTDKAVNPESAMGATKRVAEKLVVTAARSSGCRFCAVRFGNVLGSRGSVVPTFARQIELGGPVTVTHPEATRFFMELSEAVTLLLHAASLAEGGDTVMLDMGERIRVDDLARKMIRLRGLRPETDIPIAYVGLRPGEKLHEELLYAGEEGEPTSHPHIYRFDGGPPIDCSVLDREVDALLALARSGRREEIIQAVLQVAGRG